MNNEAGEESASEAPAEDETQDEVATNEDGVKAAQETTAEALPDAGDDDKKRPAEKEVDSPDKKRKPDGPAETAAAANEQQDSSESTALPETTTTTPTAKQQGSKPHSEPNNQEAAAPKPPKQSPPSNARGTPPAAMATATPQHQQQHQHIQPMLPFPAGMFSPHPHHVGGMMMNPYMNFPMPDMSGNTNVFFPGNMGVPGNLMFPPHTQQQHMYPNFSQPMVAPGIPLSLPSDMERLSEYQTYLRQQFEFFQAGPLDAQTSAQGRKRPVVVGQVGLRCRHCICLPLRSRGRGSVYFPSSLLGIYQAGQNMAGSHLATSCPRIPAPLKQELLNLRNRRDNASGGKQYWADGARALGVYEASGGGLRWRSEAPSSTSYQPQGSPPTDDSKIAL